MGKSSFLSDADPEISEGVAVCYREAAVVIKKKGFQNLFKAAEPLDGGRRIAVLLELPVISKDILNSHKYMCACEFTCSRKHKSNIAVFNGYTCV